MEENKNLVTQVTQNVEQPTEETQQPPVKTYSQDEVDAIVGKAKARAKAQIEKKSERKYGNLENVLKAGTGKESVEEMTDAFTEFYQGKGIDVRPKPMFSEKDIAALANADAQEVINGGYEEIAEEVDRLADIGVENMDARERAYFNALCKERKSLENKNELAKIGVTEDVLNNKDFQDFASMFKPDIPIAEIYKNYSKTQPKKDIKPMGSMKQDPGYSEKEYYTAEEIKNLTAEEMQDPKVWAKVRRSMTEVK